MAALEKIPKLIHCVWLGEKNKGSFLDNCMRTWSAWLPDYKILEWNEKNFDIKRNPWLFAAYERRDYAFASDLIRLYVLQEHGGIYLDVDVEVKKKFDALLKHKMFLGFDMPCLLGTAVIGAIPHHHVIGGLIAKYENFTMERIVNNTVFADYLIEHFPEFRLNGKTQIVGNSEVSIYSREYFSVPSFRKGFSYARHHVMNSWNQKSGSWSGMKRVVKCLLGETVYLRLAQSYRMRQYELYQTYLEHKKKR